LRQKRVLPVVVTHGRHDRPVLRRNRRDLPFFLPTDGCIKRCEVNRPGAILSNDKIHNPGADVKKVLIAESRRTTVSPGFDMPLAKWNALGRTQEGDGTAFTIPAFF
jgi:hypothetical protein